MSTKVKGLLKGLKHISQQIFDEKEEEFQIGLPTDVKHVAHIGSDDPSANAPSWMTEYKGGKEPPSGNAKEGENDSSQNSKGTKSRHLLPKSRHHSSESESNGTKQRTTRRHQRSSDPTADSSSQESSTGGSRHRRHRRGSNHGSSHGSSHGSDTASQEMPPSGARPRRKSKNSEDKPSSRRSSKGDSLSDISVSDFGSESGRGPDSGIAAQ